jgi:hypothetical protein
MALTRMLSNSMRARSLQGVFKRVDPQFYDKRATKVTTIEAHLKMLLHADLKDAHIVWRDRVSHMIMARK